MKQMVVGLLVVAAVFTFGPWFAGKVGPPLADAITQWATPEQPCATPTADPSRGARATKDRPRAHRTPSHSKADRMRQHPKTDRKRRPHRPPKPDHTCAPTPPATPSGSRRE